MLDPFLLSLRLGVKAKAGIGPLAIVFDPSLNIGLIKRYENKEYLQVPVRIGLMVASRLNIGVSAALNGQLDGFGNAYQIPLGVGATFALNGAVGRARPVRVRQPGGQERRRGSPARCRSAPPTTCSAGYVTR